jgi:hypothetical protein
VRRHRHWRLDIGAISTENVEFLVRLVFCVALGQSGESEYFIYIIFVQAAGHDV